MSKFRPEAQGDSQPWLSLRKITVRGIYSFDTPNIYDITIILWDLSPFPFTAFLTRGLYLSRSDIYLHQESGFLVFSVLLFFCVLYHVHHCPFFVHIYFETISRFPPCRFTGLSLYLFQEDFASGCSSRSLVYPALLSLYGRCRRMTSSFAR